MSFPRAKRFNYKYPESPSPADFNLSSASGRGFKIPKKSRFESTPKEDEPTNCCPRLHACFKDLDEPFKRNDFKRTSRRFSCKRTSVLKEQDESRKENKKNPTKQAHLKDVHSQSFEILEEFIYDDYDTFIGLGELDELSKLEQYEFAQVYKHFLEVQARNTPEKVRRNNQKMRKISNSEISKIDSVVLPNASSVPQNGINYSEIDRIVRKAVNKLRVDFKTEICRRTEEQVGKLIEMIRSIHQKAEDDIDEKCETTTSNIVDGIEKIVQRENN